VLYTINILTRQHSLNCEIADETVLLDDSVHISCAFVYNSNRNSCSAQRIMVYGDIENVRMRRCVPRGTTDARRRALNINGVRSPRKYFISILHENSLLQSMTSVEQAM
jgi:hypothetical protein